MKIDEKKLIEYLERNIGENTRTLDLAKECAVLENGDEFRINLDNDSLIRRVAKENGFRFNADHHSNDEIGMPWSIDFYIEVADVEKDIRRIMNAFQLKMRAQLIVNEYGIYDENKDVLIGFRTSIPWQIKKIYDETNEEIDELESGGRMID